MAKWNKLKSVMLTLFGGLLMTKHPDGIWSISLGRVAFWITLIPALMVWVQNIYLEGGVAPNDISENHYQILFILTAYNLSKKIVGVVGNRKDKTNIITGSEESK